MRLIDADALPIAKEYCVDEAGWGGNFYVVHKTDIDKAPTIDAEPVKHGYWDDSGRYKFPSGATAVRCTICGCALNESEYKIYNWHYCPYCGAKMDGERKET